MTIFMNNLSIKFTYFMASSYLLLAASSTSFIEAFGEGNFVDIGGKSFSVISQVISTSENGQLSHWGRFSEIYSAEQRRAIIDYSLEHKRAGEPWSKKQGAWFVDMMDDNFILNSNYETSQCKISSLQEIRDSFKFYMPEMPKASPAKSDDSSGDYVVGPARLMLFVEKNRDRAILRQGRPLLRNLPCIFYSFNYTDQAGENYEFKVYYTELSLVQNIEAHPIEIVMRREENNIMIVSFSAVDINDQSLPLMEINRFDSKSAQLFDKFVFEPILDCSEARESRAKKLFENKTDSLTTKFSFRANIETRVARMGVIKAKSVFVAYDSALKSMRVDISKYPLEEKRIFNFRINRKYHIEENFGPDSSNSGINQQVEQDVDETGVNKFERTKCLVTQLVEPDDRRPLTIGKLLAGTDKFVYIGRAQVRGISAHLYESSLSERSLPFWLEQPIVYVNKYNQTDTRQPSLGPEPRAQTDRPTVKQNILLYFGEQDLNSPLLLIEIFTFDGASSFILERSSIQIYDFAWELIESGDGERGHELFSLKGSCSDPKAASVASFKLLLESDQSSEPLSDKALSPDARNLALLASLQEKFRLPVTMINDMKTTLIRADNSIKQQNNIYKMVATFDATAHTKKMVKLIYLGKGSRSGSKARRRFIASFEDCFHKAAHRKYNIDFGYNLHKKTCFINYESIIEYQSENKYRLEGFDLDKTGPLEVYRTQHYGDQKLSDYSFWIQEVPGERTGILGTYLKLPRLQGGARDLFFTVKGVQKVYENPSGAAPIDTGYTTVGTIVGFGLLESSNGTRRLSSLPSSNTNVSPLSHEQGENDGEQNAPAMSPEQCHAACLADFNCQSFSVCVRNTELECLISKTSFRASKVIEQLANITKTNLVKTGRTVTVTLDEQSSVELARHPNCELHNKNFIELFIRRGDLALSLMNRQLIAARSRAECAEMCFANNLKVLQRDISKVKDVFSALGGYTELQVGASDGSIVPSGSEFNSTKFELLLADHRAATRQLCNRFYYLDRQQLFSGKESYEPEFRKRLLVNSSETLDDKEINGYCMQIGKMNSNSLELFKTKFNIEIYEFKADIFYEKKYGVGLKENALLRPELDAYLEVKWKGARGARAGSMSILRSLIKRGYNFQARIYENPTECARACFSQSSGPWPACRSFDIVEEGRLVWCLLNSITLSQIKSKGTTDLIQDQNKSQIWHYEPRAGLIQEESLLSGEIELIREQREAETSFEYKKGLGLGDSPGLVFFIVLAAVICGSTLGIWRGRHILADEKKESQLKGTNIDTNGLVEPLPSVSFSNQANPDGEVRVELGKFR